VIAHPAGLAAAEHEMSTGAEWGLILIAVAVAVTGILFSRSVYGGDQGTAKGRTWAERFPFVHDLLVHKYYVDEAYDTLIVRPLYAFSRFLWKVVDTFVIDRTINAGAFLTELTGDVGRFTTTGNVRNYALYFFLGVILLFGWIAFG